MLTAVSNNKMAACGNTLPALYIEKVAVYDSYLEVTLTYYIYASAAQDISEVVSTVSDVNFYVCPVFDGYPAPEEVSGIAYGAQDISKTNRIGQLISLGRGVPNYISKLMESDEMFDVFIADDDEDFNYYSLYNHKGAFGISANEFELVEEEVGTIFRTAKYSRTLTITPDYLGTSTPSSDDISDSYGDIFLNAANLDFDLTLISFSTTVDLGHDFGGEMFAEFATSLNETPRLKNLYRGFFSDISHQHIFKRGQMHKEPIPAYVLPNMIPYNGDVLQTINGDYRQANATVNNAMMVSRFRELLQESTSAHGEYFDSAMSTFTMLLIQFAESPFLLKNLNEFGLTYVDKSRATVPGRWYHSFRRTLLSLNDMVRQLPMLRKQLITTPVLIDYRSETELNYTSPDPGTYDTSEDYIFTNEGSFIMSRIGIFDRSQYTWLSEDPDIAEKDTGDALIDTDLFYSLEYVNVDTGFFFFDYEKAIRTQTTLSHYLNFDALTSFFGQGLINQHFKLDEVELWRFNSDGTIISRQQTTYDSSLESSGPSIVSASATVSYGTVSDMGYSPGLLSYNYDTEDVGDERLGVAAQLSDNTEILYPELMLRNFALPGQSEQNEYRLMAFQFMGLYDSDGTYETSPRIDDYYVASVTCIDYTKQLIMAMTSSLANYTTGSFADYLAAAQEYCSYNNVDGFFNDFFASNAEAQFGGEPGSAPWIWAPTIYNLHREMLYAHFGGNLQLLTSNTISLSERISPHTGRLDELEDFAEDLQGLLDFYDSIDLSAWGSERSITFGSTQVPVSQFGRPTFPDFEIDPIYEDPDYEPPEPERTWHETHIYTYEFGKYFIGVDDGKLKAALTTRLNNWNAGTSSDPEFNDDYQEMWDEIEEWIEAYDGVVRDEVEDGDASASRTASFQDEVDPEWNDIHWPHDMLLYEFKISYKDGDKNDGRVDVWEKAYYIG
tara:strand:+ start:14387 stop:17239 length:2853 start_codon:yes stop_codon:yes gene_type:complete